MQTDAPRQLDANAATLLLSVLEAFANVPAKGNAASALAAAMPFSDRSDEYSTGLRRCLVMLDAVDHLEAITAAHPAVPQQHVAPVIKELRSLFTDGLRALEAERRWFFQTLKPETTRGLAFIAHTLPKDRYSLLAVDRQYLLQALTTLRRARDTAGPVLRDLLADYIASLEDVLLRTTVQGSRPLAEIIFHWKLSHEIARKKSSSELDGVEAETREAIKDIVARSRSALDDVLRAAGAAELLEKIVPMLPGSW